MQNKISRNFLVLHISFSLMWGAMWDAMMLGLVHGEQRLERKEVKTLVHHTSHFYNPPGS